MPIDPRIREFATERQREIIDAVVAHGSQRKAAKALGITHGTVGKRVKDAEKRAARAGYSPAHDMIRPAPDGVKFAGTDTQSSVGGSLYCVAPVAPNPHRPFRRILCIPDVHAPYEDKAAVDLVIRAAKRIKPDVTVIIGDFADCFSISSFPKSPERKQSLKWEIEQVEKCLAQFDGISDEVIFCEGNHEERLERYLCQRAPELYGLVTIRDLLGINRRGWKWIPYKSWITIGKVAFGHEFGHFGKYALHQSLASFGHNVVFGHSHRGGTHYEGTIDGERRFAMNIGWLGDPAQADYMHRAQTRVWQHGIGIVDQDQDGNSWAQFVPIVKGRMMIGGELFS
jgi:predicted phosphodiesterase